MAVHVNVLNVGANLEIMPVSVLVAAPITAFILLIAALSLDSKMCLASAKGSISDSKGSIRSKFGSKIWKSEGVHAFQEQLDATTVTVLIGLSCHRLAG